MIPLSDTEPNRYRGISIMVILLVLVNIGVFFATPLLIGNNPQRFFDLYTSTPILILSRQGGGIIASITHMFLHGDLLHLGGNMLALWVFGRRLENACGSWRFLMFYLTCGMIAEITSTMFLVLSGVDLDVPSIGASGAVFGVMGAYMALFYSGRIRVLVVWFIPFLAKIRAFWVILYFLGIQLVPAFNTLVHGESYRVGHWAHLGGFGGAILVFFFMRPEAFERYQNDEPV
jgi:membrane associated rhomboid family serine protease